MIYIHIKMNITTLSSKLFEEKLLGFDEKFRSLLIIENIRKLSPEQIEVCKKVCGGFWTVEHIFKMELDCLDATQLIQLSEIKKFPADLDVQYEKVYKSKMPIIFYRFMELR